MKQFSHILKSTKSIKTEVINALSLIDSHPYQLPDTTLQSLGDLHDRLSVEFVDDCGSRTRTISMTMNELKSLINSLEKKNKEIEEYNKVLKEQELAFRRINNHSEANRIECQMRQPYWISPIREIYDKKLKGGYDGEDKIDFPQKINRCGYYTRGDDKPKVVLENSTIYGVIPTYIHEMMHAYFDEKLGRAMNDAEFAEEPLAEYGMLKFLKSFVNANPGYDFLLDNASRTVRFKQQSFGLAHYGFGEYLYLNHSSIPWEQMLHSATPLIGDNVTEYKDLMQMLYFAYPDESELPKVAQTLYDVLCTANGTKTTTIKKMDVVEDQNMMIKTVCSAVRRSLPILSGAMNPRDAIDHSLVESFQKEVCNALNAAHNGYIWSIDVQAKGRLKKDLIDILGKAKGQKDWILEIDATRSDQVSQKLLSRLSLCGKKDPIQYVAILYPDAHNKGKSACEKYLQYGNEICQNINKDSSVVGIFVDPVLNTVEVLQFGGSGLFYVNGTKCKSLSNVNKKAFIVYYNSTKKKNSRSYLKEDGDFRGEVELNKQLASNPLLIKAFPGVSSFFDINDPNAIQGLLDWVNKNKPLFGVYSGGTPDIATVLRKYIDFLL